MKFIKICVLVLFFTLFALAMTKRSRRTHTSIANIPYATSTSFQSTDGIGNIYYLDRHEPTCSNGAMTYFRLQRSSNNVSYSVNCIRSEAIGYTVNNYFTGYNGTNGAKSVNYLDRHDVTCPNGQVLRSFRLTRQPSNNSNVRYDFSCVNAEILCCKSYTNGPTDMGNRSAFYLDRQPVGQQNTTNFAMRRFKLNTSYGPDRLFFLYEMCKLKDMDAARAVEQNQLNLKSNQVALQNANTELELAKSAFNAAQARVTALTAKVAQSKTDLTASQNNPGLSC